LATDVAAATASLWEPIDAGAVSWLISLLDGIAGFRLRRLFRLFIRFLRIVGWLIARRLIGRLFRLFLFRCFFGSRLLIRGLTRCFGRLIDDRRRLFLIFLRS
jgi:hypothetical protein